MEWQPIETAPKDGTHILGFGSGAWTPNGCAETFSGVDYFGNPYWVLCIRNDAESDYWEPTHWMPIPAPPT